jgi:predicted dehydrogenase
MRKIPVLMIGCGYISQAEHIPNWRVSPSGTIVAVVDAREEMARAVGEDVGVPWFTDVPTALDQSECEAVHICTPAKTHVALIEQAVKRGLHVIVEKPLAENPEDAQRAVDAARAARVVLMVGYNRLLDVDLGQLEKWIKGGDIGRVFGVQSVWKTSQPSVYRRLTGLPRTTLMPEGVSAVEILKYRMREESIHHLNLFQRWLGKSPQVEVVLENLPLWHVSFTFGESIPVWHTNAGPVGQGEEIWAYGDGGYAYARPWSPHFPWTFGYSELVTRRDGTAHEPALARVNSYALLLEEFTASIREQRPPAIDPESAIEDLRLVESIAHKFAQSLQSRRQSGGRLA